MTFAELQETTDAPVILANEQGRITFINQQLQDTLGWRPADLVGHPLTTIIPKSLHDAHNLGFSRFLTTEKPTLLNKPLKLKAMTKDGRELPVELVIIAEQSKGKWLFGASLRLRES